MNELLQAETSEAPWRPTTLLVVEDEAIVARDLEVTLRGLGYDVAGTVGDARTAIAVAERLRPDLVLMDIRLQGAGDGIEAAAEMWHRLGLPVVFLTAYADDATLGRARAALPFGYLVKPFLAQQLRPAIEIAVHKERAERALRQSERRLREALGALGEGILLAGPDGRIRWANPRAEELCATGPGRLAGRPLAEVLPGVALDRADDGTLAPLAAGDPPLDYSSAPLRAGPEAGTVVALRARVVPAGARDRDAHAALQRVVTGFAAQAQAPLLALAATLERGVAADAVPLLRRQVERIRDLVAYVVEYAGADALEPERLELAEVAAGAAADVRALAQARGVALEVQAGDGVAIDADPARLRAALAAVLENAVLHAPAGTPVLVRVRQAGGQGICTVEDHGAGFAPGDLPRLFDPFFSRRAGGTGMGLALARRVAERHGGAVRAENRPEGGARVTLQVPLRRP